MSDTSSTPKTPKRRAATAAQVDRAELPPPPPPPPTPPQRLVSPRALRIALAVSVAVNLAVLGAVAGSFWHKGGMDERGAMTRDLGFGPFGEALAPEDRRALREWLKDRAPELREANTQRRADVAAVQSALRAQPFSPEALRSALNSMRGRMEGQLALGHEALTAVILAMPDAERLALADRLDRGLRQGGKDGPDGRKDGKGDGD